MAKLAPPKKASKPTAPKKLEVGKEMAERKANTNKLNAALNKRSKNKLAR